MQCPLGHLVQFVILHNVWFGFIETCVFVVFRRLFAYKSLECDIHSTYFECVCVCEFRSVKELTSIFLPFAHASLSSLFFMHSRPVCSLVDKRKRTKPNQPMKLTEWTNERMEPLLQWHNLVYQMLPISIDMVRLGGRRLAAPIALCIETKSSYNSSSRTVTEGSRWATKNKNKKKHQHQQ